MGLASRWQSLQQRIASACERAGRSPESVGFLAVSKGHPPQTIAEAAGLGLRCFGENRVQEAKAKIPLCPGHLEWHMIGHLQTNKCRDALHLFRTIESVDSLALAEALEQGCAKAGRRISVLAEVNVAGEATKHGFAADALPRAIIEINQLPHLTVEGLMTLAPWTPTPEKVRPVFRQLRELKMACEDVLGAPLPCLSMGMSGDFEVAIEEGATQIRVGSALFGPRKPLK